MLYSSGNFVFQSNNIASETLGWSYDDTNNFGSTNYNLSNTPWNSRRVNIRNVSFKTQLSPASISQWFKNCVNLININYTNLNINSITNMHNSFWNCRKYTGSPISGTRVTDMSNAYRSCRYLTGSPKCGANVTNMRNTYEGCQNLTGSPVCGKKVKDMYRAYSDCYNLTGTPVCGNNVTNFALAYINCKNLNASNIYIYAKNITCAWGCFCGKNNSRRYNIHVPSASTTLNSFLISNNSSIVDAYIEWIDNGNYYYNYSYNLYIYPDL